MITVEKSENCQFYFYFSFHKYPYDGNDSKAFQNFVKSWNTRVYYVFPFHVHLRYVILLLFCIYVEHVFQLSRKRAVFS